MRYIEKLDIPTFFIEDTSTLRESIKTATNKNKFWNKYKKKKYLKKYILDNEQNYLCCYCESRVTFYGDEEKDGSHIEHIKPKSSNYEILTFDYYNLVVSCQGTCHNEEQDNSRYSCGHKKDDEYDELLFLDPTKEIDIEKYFEYEEYIDEDKMTKVKIKESSKNYDKASYMIRILNLNDKNTKIELNRYIEFEKLENNILELELNEDETVEWLDNENLQFISYLKYKYSFLFQN